MSKVRGTNKLSAHYPQILTFYFLGFGNEEKEKIFPTKIKLVEVWCFFLTQFLQPADTFLTAESPGGRNVKSWLKYTDILQTSALILSSHSPSGHYCQLLSTESISCKMMRKLLA